MLMQSLTPLPRCPAHNQALRTTYKLKTELCERLRGFVAQHPQLPESRRAAEMAIRFYNECLQREAGGGSSAHKQQRAPQQQPPKPKPKQPKQQPKQQQHQQQQQHSSARPLGPAGGCVNKRQQHQSRAAKAGAAAAAAAAGGGGGSSDSADGAQMVPSATSGRTTSGTSHQAVEALMALQQDTSPVRPPPQQARGIAAAAFAAAADAARSGAPPPESPQLLMPLSLQVPLGQLLTSPGALPMLRMFGTPQQQLQQQCMELSPPQQMARVTAAAAAAVEGGGGMATEPAPMMASPAGNVLPSSSSTLPAGAAPRTRQQQQLMPPPRPPTAHAPTPAQQPQAVRMPPALAAHALGGVTLSQGSCQHVTAQGLMFRCPCGHGAEGSGGLPAPAPQVFCVVCGVLQHAPCVTATAGAAAAGDGGHSIELPSPVGGHMCDVCRMVVAAADEGRRLQYLMMAPRLLALQPSAGADEQGSMQQQAFRGSFLLAEAMHKLLSTHAREAAAAAAAPGGSQRPEGARFDLVVGCLPLASAAAAATIPAAHSGSSSNTDAAGCCRFVWPAGASLRINGGVIDASAAAESGSRLVSIAATTQEGANQLELTCTGEGG
jgi:hypothetical protein